MAGYLGDPNAVRLFDLIVQHLRQPATTSLEGSVLVTTFEPPLSPAEQATFDTLVLLARSDTGLSPTDYAAVRTQMQTLRAMRQLGRNAYVNLSEGDRNRQTYDCLDAICEIFLKLTRDV